MEERPYSMVDGAIINDDYGEFLIPKVGVSYSLRTNLIHVLNEFMTMRELTARSINCSMSGLYLQCCL